MRLLAKPILGVSRAVAGYSSRLGNIILNISKGIASFDNSELAIILKEHDFDVTFRKAEDTESHSYDDFYASGSLYLNKYANPIKIVPSDIEDSDKNYDLITSSKYKAAMSMNVIRDAFDTGGTGLDMVEKLLIANIAAIVGVGIIIFMVMG